MVLDWAAPVPQTPIRFTTSTTIITIPVIFRYPSLRRSMVLHRFTVLPRGHRRVMGLLRVFHRAMVPRRYVPQAEAEAVLSPFW